MRASSSSHRPCLPPAAVLLPLWVEPRIKLDKEETAGASGHLHLKFTQPPAVPHAQSTTVLLPFLRARGCVQWTG
jgi:hypothetical protein